MWVAAPRRLRENYGVEVVGDPWDVFAKGVVGHPLRPLLRFWFASSQWAIVRGACCVAYVTDEYLQKRYPPERGAYSTTYSSVSLPKDLFKGPSGGVRSSETLSIIVVGSIAQHYKGVETVLEAVARLRRAGHKATLTVVGGGPLQGHYSALAESLGIADLVSFVGQVPPADVRNYLDRSDVFVSASRTEGVARAAVEAMARSKPVISTPVGGMREIVAPDGKFAVDDVDALIRCLQRLARDPEYYAALVDHSTRTAERFREEILAPRRARLYAELADRALMGAT
ncbi:glycosyltransferase family 4 protein [Ornithinimicrobium sp. LYQ121]|uniref:glycosyltransferase family 4 protein n=1 Tax=Ornithinimicrobium sp. LYQ121 TaxID=3378801 RepID=UPI003854E838